MKLSFVYSEGAGGDGIAQQPCEVASQALSFPRGEMERMGHEGGGPVSTHCVLHASHPWHHRLPSPYGCVPKAV